MAAGRFRELDRDVRRLDRLAALGKLTAEIAHEVRNPLVSVKTFLQLLPERGADPEFTDSFLTLVNDELRRMERLLDVIIQHAQPAGPSGDLPDSSGASLDDAMTTALALVSHRSDKGGIALDCDDLARLPRVALDADGLRQVVLNLLLNAIEATPPGASVHVSASSDAACVTFQIADQGPGIAPELREEIFTAFYSTRSERSGGLGLAITRRIVMEAGGTITAAGGERGGAIFTVRVPVVAASTA
jgi:signal transduction histidine kinase